MYVGIYNCLFLCWHIYICVFILFFYNFFYNVAAIISDECVKREELGGWLICFVKIGISTTLVCFCGMDDLDVDGRRYAVYNDTTVLLLSFRTDFKFGDISDEACVVVCFGWYDENMCDKGAWSSVLTPRTGRNTSEANADLWSARPGVHATDWGGGL